MSRLALGRLLLFLAELQAFTDLSIIPFESFVPLAGPLMETYSKDFSMSLFKVDLNLVLTRFTQLAPLSGQAFDTGVDSIMSAMLLILE